MTNPVTNLFVDSSLQTETFQWIIHLCWNITTKCLNSKNKSNTAYNTKHLNFSKTNCLNHNQNSTSLKQILQLHHLDFNGVPKQ